MGDFNKLLICHPDFGPGKVVSRDDMYLVYFFKEHPVLHEGNGDYPNHHCWYMSKITLSRCVLIKASLRLCIERRRNEPRMDR